MEHLSLDEDSFSDPFTYASAWSAGGAADQALALLFGSGCINAWGRQQEPRTRNFYIDNFKPGHMFSMSAEGKMPVCHVCRAGCSHDSRGSLDMFIVLPPRPLMTNFMDDPSDFEDAIRSGKNSRSLILQTTVKARLKYTQDPHAPSSWKQHVADFPCPLDYIYSILRKHHASKQIIDLDLSSKDFGLPTFKKRLFILACDCNSDQLEVARAAIVSMSSLHERADMLAIHALVDDSGLERFPHPGLTQAVRALLWILLGRRALGLFQVATRSNPGRTHSRLRPGRTKVEPRPPERSINAPPG
jgi:hypothetical protein